MGHGHQHRRPDLLDLLLHFLFLPHRKTSHSEDNELEYCYVWWYHGLCHHLLYNHRAQAVQAARQSCAQRVIEICKGQVHMGGFGQGIFLAR